MRKMIVPIIAICFVSIMSCDLFNMMNSEYLEVTDWSPKQTSITDNSNIDIYVGFSKAPKKTITEEAFSLTYDGIEVPGRKIWKDDKTLRYNLYHPLEDGRDYILKVSTNAEDKDGNSLKQDFSFRFSTKISQNRPKVLGINPSPFSTVNDSLSPITISFDKSMNYTSVIDSFSISPSVSGYFTWDKNQQIFTFNPKEEYKYQEEYTVTLASSLEDKDKWNIGYDFTSSFNVGIDTIYPQISAVSDSTNSFFMRLENEEDDEFTVTRDWEVNRDIYIQFTKSMDRNKTKNSLVIEPQTAYDITWDHNTNGDVMIIEWKEPLKYGTIYTMRITNSALDIYNNSLVKTAVYNFESNGHSSIPPELIKLVYIKEPMTNPFREEVLYNKNTPSENKVDFIFSNKDEINDGSPLKVCFDFYFSLADDAYINLFSFMENFAVLPQDSALTFTPTKVIAQTDTTVPDFGGSISPILTDSNGTYIIARVYGNIDDSDIDVGMVDFKVYKDFEDTLGNKMSEDWYWQVFDKDE
ncbi:Ig-like domain-containing protein [Spirochaeta cellobiosiphila]|uniref:Ig-like domain-containing protein n=1 Tax=Spirochaeta cellobiosiphila TaxID=504483 RepID=UPI000424AE49|nr:Ig-like domain-containing protein [Spirochaeta cellobiosiphila]